MTHLNPKTIVKITNPPDGMTTGTFQIIPIEDAIEMDAENIAEYADDLLNANIAEREGEAHEEGYAEAIGDVRKFILAHIPPEHEVSMLWHLDHFDAQFEDELKQCKELRT